MKKNYLKKNQVNLNSFLFDLSKKKFLFFKIIIFFFLLNSPYFFLKQYHIRIDNNYIYFNNILSKFNFSEVQKINASNKFFNIINNNLDSKKNFNNFIKLEKKPQYYDFLLYKIEFEFKKKNYKPVIFLLPNNVDGGIFLNNYLNFIINKSISEFNNELKMLIKQNILKHEKALEIARTINLENPIIKEKQLDSDDLEVSNNYYLYYEGTKILNIRINWDKILLEEIDNNFLNYYFIDKILITSKPLISEKFLLIFNVIFRIIVSSFILYFLIIFFRNAKINRPIKNVRSLKSRIKQN